MNLTKYRALTVRLEDRINDRHACASLRELDAWALSCSNLAKQLDGPQCSTASDFDRESARRAIKRARAYVALVELGDITIKRRKGASLRGAK